MTLGLAYFGKHNPDEAFKQFEQVNQLNPKIALNHYYLARVRLARRHRHDSPRGGRGAIE